MKGILLIDEYMILYRFYSNIRLHVKLEIFFDWFLVFIPDRDNNNEIFEDINIVIAFSDAGNNDLLRFYHRQ